MTHTLDDTTLRNALLLAEAWEPALSTSYRLGRDDGFAAGYAASERDMAEAWSEVARTIRAGANDPAHMKLHQTRYDETPTRCTKTSCDGCSRCAWALSYVERGGRPYLGAEHEAALATAPRRDAA